ncbi:E3 ubiquitin-protein ligase UBR5 [Geodia barretti]|nr:E3 ubiquitin-protein ligase UBR5 [Geodia barretti]
MSPTNLSNLIDPHLLGVWSSSSSSDEDGFNTETFFTFEEAADTSPPRPREQALASPDNIYPFAWALDGRRIGESSNSSFRSDSPSHFLFGGHHEQNMPLFTIPSVRFGAGFLSRTFSRFVKDLVDIAVTICDDKTTKTKLVLPAKLQCHLVRQTLSQLESTWRWVIKVLDVAEGQLQRGQNFDVQRHVMSLRSDGPTPTTSSHTPSHDSYRSFIGSTPAEYMTYLLRAHAKEDTDCLPVIDLYGYEHVVFVLDALIYTLTHWPKAAVVQTDQSNQSNPATTSPPSSGNQSTNQNTGTEPLQMEHTSATDMDTAVARDERFFKRSESILASSGTSESEGDHETQKSNQNFFGPRRALIESPDFVGNESFFGGGASEGQFSQPLSEAYPLAQQPHLLKPNAKKEQLFSTPGRLGGEGEGGGGGEGREERRTGRRELPVSYDSSEGSAPAILPPVTLSLSVDTALQRWHNCISVFAHVFLAEGPGGERDNFLNARAGFASRMARFRQQVSQLYDAAMTHREWSSSVSNSLSLKIRRDFLLQDALENMQQLTKFHYSQVRVKFEGEEGSGPGVNRGFFSSLANELKSSDTSKPVLKQVGVLLSEPGKQPEQSGLFAPCPFLPSHSISPSKLTTIREQRRKYFRAVGRFLGLCFWFRYTIPLMVCRHVAKYLLGRDLAWHDLAFYNADLYEGLRRMLQDVQEEKKSEEDFTNTYCCYFEAPLSGSVEPFLVDLIPGGSKIPVTPDRVQEYVRLYATFMMYGCVRDELKAMKEGLNDVIPPELLSGLTAEDFQLLLSGGSASISLSRLKSVIRFNHTHGSSPTVCDRFEKMFWRVVSHMTNTQRQELLYFATGSGALPSSSESNDQNPAIQITINVIGTGNTKSLPVASTCSQRMSIPLYPSYLILKKKLLQAIQCQAYGLG